MSGGKTIWHGELAEEGKETFCPFWGVASVNGSLTRGDGANDASGVGG